MGRPINSGVERGFQDYLRSLNIPAIGDRVYTIHEASTVTTPCVFIIAGKSSEIFPNAGIYRVPFDIRTVYVAQDLKEGDSGSLDNLTTTIENALTSSKAYVNANSPDIFCMYLSEPGTQLEVVEHTYQQALSAEVVCKAK